MHPAQVFTTPITETANDRLKHDEAAWLPRGIIAAVAIHFAVFAFWPEMTVAGINGDARDEFIVMPPTLDMPKPPEVIRRPALPQVSSTDVADDVTIPPTTFSEWTPDRLEAPPARADSNAREDFAAFVPSMVAPRLLNAAAVERALQQNYPPMLRDAGVGGTVEVALWLDGDGSIVRAEVAKSSGYPAFDAAALRVVDVMRLSPAMSMGRATRVIVALPIVFTVR